MRDNIKTMSKGEFKQLQQLIEKELILRQKEERKMAEKEIYGLLSVISDMCNRYDITLYDGYGGIIIPEEITL